MTGSEPDVLRTLPRPLVWISAAVTAIGVVMMGVGAWVIGATWDAKTHVVYLQNYFQTGWHTDPIAILPNGTPDPAFLYGVYVYGPVGELLSHAVTAALGLEPWGQPSFEAAAQAGRQLGIALLAALAIAAAALTVRLITDSWRWAVLGAAVLASTPLWIGHGMMNIKDSPVASGYTIGTLGVVALCHPLFRKSRWVTWGGLAALVLGAVLASGTREAMGMPLAAAVVAGPVAFLVLAGRSRVMSWGGALRDSAVRLGAGVSGLVVAYLALVVIYPKAYADPLTLAWQALVVSARFPFGELVLTGGVLMDQPPPWTYLPVWFLAQLPLLVLAGAIAATLAWLIATVRMIVVGRSWPAASPWVLTMVMVVGLQAAMMPILGIALRSTMYNGTRQFLFVVPAVAILAVVGLWWLVPWVAARAPRWVGVTMWMLVAVGIVAPLVIQMRLFPYNYVSYNAVATAQGIEDRWPTDYWRAASNELMRRLPAEGQEYCAYETVRKKEPSECAIEGMFQPYLPERGIDARPGILPEDGWWLVRENQGVTDTPDGCSLHDQITRQLWGRTIIIGQIYACQ